MEMPAAASPRIGALAKNGFFGHLRPSISAHGIYLLIVAVYYASFLVLLRLYPDFVPTDFVVAAIGFAALSVIFIFLCVFIMRFYHIATVVKPERPLPGWSTT